MIEVTRTDPFTGKSNTMSLDVTREQIDSWIDGEFIQNAFPNLTAEEREFIKTGIPLGSWSEFIGGDAPWDDDDIIPTQAGIDLRIVWLR
jgi:hypothetical protein